MRTPLILVWLLLPVLVGAYHYGPGQRRVELDRASALLSQAQKDVSAEQWSAAVEKFDQALSLVPSERVNETRRIRLERAKAQMMAKQLPLAHSDLKSMLDEMLDDESADETLLSEVRGTLANSQYYLTWLMRLEGQPRDVWEPEIEAARQSYRLLAEAAQQNGEAATAKKAQEDLEATIRLARMDLSELQGLPLPSQ